jgi:hypothetical protein
MHPTAMTSAPMLVIHVCEPARSLPLSVARAQAYEVAGPLTGWHLLPTDTEPSYSFHIGKRAVVLVGARSSDITQWLRSKWAVIADGVWSHDPADITEVVALAHELGQVLLEGDELLHAPVLAGALTEAAEIGAITSCEFRSVHPQGSVTEAELRSLHAPSVLMRALLCLKVLWPRELSDGAIWEAVTKAGSAGQAAQITVVGKIPPTSLSPSSRIHVTISTHRGRSVIQDLQFSSATKVVRADVLPTPSLEVNGEPVRLPEPTHIPAQLEWFGMVSMLQLMLRAVRERTQPLTSPSLLATAAEILSK